MAAKKIIPLPGLHKHRHHPHKGRHPHPPKGHRPHPPRKPGRHHGC